MPKRFEIDFNIRQPSMEVMRLMKEGEVVCFSAGSRKPSGAFSASSNTTRTATMLGMKVEQRTCLLADPVTYKSIPVLLVRCVSPCSMPKKKRGRRPKQENP